MAEEGKRLASSNQHKFWPQFLFHTTHVTNAVSIVKHGCVFARNNISDFYDVANQGALAAYTDSHDNARLYFRPKNSYHLKTEGIKCRNNPYREGNQMSIPACFVFKFDQVITLPNAVFSAGNIQRSRNVWLTGDSEFDTLDFKAIYHDSWVTPEQKTYIHDCRMAEVAIPQCLPLANNLRAIVFRTKLDLSTFRYMLSLENVQCPYPTGTEQVSGSLFMRKGLFLSEISFNDDAINLTFHFPDSHAPKDNKYLILCRQKSELGNLKFEGEVELVTPSLVISKFRPDPKSVWTIRLEDELAFDGVLQHAKSELFG
jgi:hypothetical protein